MGIARQTSGASAMRSKTRGYRQREEQKDGRRSVGKEEKLDRRDDRRADARIYK
jgi:hypothetical protein